MSELVGHSAVIARRHLAQVFRQPWLLAINLVQPFLWLLLFGATFRSVMYIPGFTEDNYVQFFLPGLITMTVLLASGWSGLALLADLERGTLDRLLASPARRPALIIGPMLQQAVSGLVPTAILMSIGLAMGATFRGGLAGVAALVLAVTAVSAALAACSNAVALLVRREESLIAMVNFVVMPLTFLSTAFMPAQLMPGWVAVATRFNPVDWAVQVSRAAYTGGSDVAGVAARLGLLWVLAAGSVTLAVAALRNYRRRA